MRSSSWKRHPARDRPQPATRVSPARAESSSPLSIPTSSSTPAPSTRCARPSPVTPPSWRSSGRTTPSVATHGAVAAFRNLLHHTIHQRSQGTVTTFWAGIGAVRRPPSPTQEDSMRPVPPRVDRRHRARGTARRPRDDRPRRSASGHAPEGVDARRDDRDRPASPWDSVGPPDGGAEIRSADAERRHARAAEHSSGVAQHLCGRTPAASPRGDRDRGAAQPSTAISIETSRTRKEPRGVALGLPLHTLHQLIGVVAIPCGLASHLLEQREGL